MYKLFFLSFLFLMACNAKHEIRNSIVQKNQIHSRAEEFAQGEEMSDPNNVLENKIQTLELEYIVWGCACANWVTNGDYEKYKDGNLKDHCIFIEPEHSKLELRDNFDAFKNRIRVIGQFYKNKDYPKGTIKEEENLAKAKVFRYTKIEIIPR